MSISQNKHNYIRSYVDTLQLKWTPYDNLIRLLIARRMSYEDVMIQVRFIYGLPYIPERHFENIEKSIEDYLEYMSEWAQVFNKYSKLFFHRNLRILLIATITAGEDPDKISKMIKSKSPYEIPPEDIVKIANLFWNLRKVSILNIAIFLEYLKFTDSYMEQIIRRALARYDLENLYIELDIIPDDEIDVRKMARALAMKAFHQLMKSRKSLDAQRYAEILTRATDIILTASGEDSSSLEDLLARLGVPEHQPPEMEVNPNIRRELEVEKKEINLQPKDPKDPIGSLPFSQDRGSIAIRLEDVGEEIEEKASMKDFFPDIDPWNWMD